MHWAAINKVPWRAGFDPTEDANDIALYRALGQGGYCFTIVLDPELRSRLEKSGKDVIDVRYNVVRDFGKMRSYSLRSVDGLPYLKEGHIYRRSSERSGRTAEAEEECP